MTKKIYIFNCEGTFDAHQIFELYVTIKKITGIECNKYSLLFKDESGKLRSRTGSVKNMETNIRRYLLSCSKFEFSAVEMNDKPQDAHYLDTEKRQHDFVIDQRKTHFSIYIVLPHSLNEANVIDAWNQISAQYSTNYMVHYDFDVKKSPELCMYGRPFVNGLESPEEYYTESEYKIVHRLHDLQIYETLKLDDVFPICIATKNVSVAEQSYKSKINIGSDTYLFSK